MRPTVIACFSLCAILVPEFPAHAQNPKLSESSLRVAEINRRIEEQLSANKALSLKRDKLKSDSAMADAKADKRIDSLAGIIDDLNNRAGREKTAQTALREQLSALRADKAKREAERDTAAHISHLAIAAFEPLLAACKDSMEAARSDLDLARADSANLVKRFSLENSRRRDSLAALETLVGRCARTLDSLGAAVKKQAHDGLAAGKMNDDSLAASMKRLSDLRLLVASKDSAVKRATEQINSSRRDSLAAQTENRKVTQKRERDIAALDSIVTAVQNDKDRLFRMREKFHLDSAIETLSGQLNDFLHKPFEARSAATGLDAEKAEILDVYKGQLDNLMRNEGFAALVAKVPGKTWQERNGWVGKQLDAVQKTLDSASQTREKVVREDVLADKQFAQVVKNFEVQNKRLGDLIAKTWKELINAKPEIERMERDSAEAARRCETSSAAFQKTHAALLADSAKAAAAADSVARLRDAIKAFTGRGDAHQKDLANASLPVVQAAEIVHRSQAVMDAVAARRQTARDDSVRTDKEKNAYVIQADTAIESKQEELRLKQSALESLAGRVTKARSDSSAAVRDKREQENVFGQLLADQRRMALKLDAAVKNLESERAAAVAAPPAPVAPAPPAPAPVPVVQATAAFQEPGPASQPSAAQEAARQRLTLIYDLIEHGKPDSARLSFAANRKQLEEDLDTEAFQTIKKTLESLEPSQSPSAKPQATLPIVPAPPAAAETSPPVQPQPAAVPVASTPPASEPYVERKPATVFISSMPPGASVYMDGQQIGSTNTGYVKVTSGKHTMQFIKGDKMCTQDMTFTEGENPAIVVKLPCGQ